MQFQPCDLDRAQPQPGEEDDDREVADPDVGAAVATLQQALDRVVGHRGRRQGRQTPPADRRDRGSQPQTA
ncbi:hypothetical protein N801_04025 [Knoellia aerolata DSM 18566]|uniref:Uncharacterized protein n=1 Tax=Knoellia aerolata DSM 18566 TaxID=1385519 RepID=A0A0A0K0J5_9MICO|nr:hypothetical protein N801_04025 [Knoellia aerolata DSM 18566]